jgi:hypoxanthine phosphoribosyltransferase
MNNSEQHIRIQDKIFAPYILYSDIEKATERIAQEINIEFKDTNPLFVITLNGAFMFASDLLKKINIDCEVSFAKLSSYDGMKSTENIRELIGVDDDIRNRHIVIIEDIIDTGLTMNYLLKKLTEKGTACVKIVSLLFKSEAFTKDYAIDYIGFTIPNNFVVGYGLDYNGYGRNLTNIYTHIE